MLRVRFNWNIVPVVYRKKFLYTDYSLDLQLDF